MQTAPANRRGAEETFDDSGIDRISTMRTLPQLEMSAQQLRDAICAAAEDAS